MLLHLALPADWENACAAGVYEVSTRDRTIAEVGFLHASWDLDQARRVAGFVYDDVPELVLLQIDQSLLREHGLTVREEPGDPNDPDSERFPHVYGGPLPVSLLTAGPWPPPEPLLP